jgi:VanZ family protein
MTDPTPKAPADAARGRWIFWLVYLIVWTAGLLAPLGDGSDLGGLGQSVRFYVGKSLHVVGYAGLAALSGRLGVSFPLRLTLLFGAMVHATATELLQQHVFGRSGLLTDVALDHLGIGVGLALTWRWWSAPVCGG